MEGDLLLDKPSFLGPIMRTLRALQRHGPILPAAAIHLECLLVTIDIELDTGPRTPQSRNGALLAPIKGSFRFAVDKVGGVVAGAVEAAVAEKIRVGEVGADLLGRGPEVVEGVFLVG